MFDDRGSTMRRANREELESAARPKHPDSTTPKTPLLYTPSMEYADLMTLTTDTRWPDNSPRRVPDEML